MAKKKPSTMVFKGMAKPRMVLSGVGVVLGAAMMLYALLQTYVCPLVDLMPGQAYPGCSFETGVLFTYFGYYVSPLLVGAFHIGLAILIVSGAMLILEKTHRAELAAWFVAALGVLVIIMQGTIGFFIIPLSLIYPTIYAEKKHSLYVGFVASLAMLAVLIILGSAIAWRPYPGEISMLVLFSLPSIALLVAVIYRIAVGKPNRKSGSDATKRMAQICIVGLTAGIITIVSGIAFPSCVIPLCLQTTPQTLCEAAMPICSPNSIILLSGLVVLAISSIVLVLQLKKSKK